MFDQRYYYILPGWEEYIYNSEDLIDKIQNQGFVILEEKYFLANIKYSNLDYVIILYWSIQYHLKKQNLVA